MAPLYQLAGNTASAPRARLAVVRSSSRRATMAQERKEEVEERTEELEERIDAHADALPVRFGSPRLGDLPLSSAAQAGLLSPFGQPLMMFPAILRQK
jgi:hypothetical protein